MKRSHVLAAIVVLLALLGGWWATSNRPKPTHEVEPTTPPGPAEPRAEHPTLTIDVVDVDGAPVPGAAVAIMERGRATTSDEFNPSDPPPGSAHVGRWNAPDGSYTARLPPGDYEVTARHPDYIAHGAFAPLELVHLTAGSRTTVSLTLRRAGFVSGRVVSDGTPVEDATVRVREMNTGAPAPNADTGADGTFRVRVFPGRVRLLVQAPGAAPATSPEIAVADGEEISGVEIAVSRGGTLIGQVVSHSGDPVGVNLSVVDESGAEPRTVSTDREGRFRATQLHVGTVRVTARTDEYEEQTVEAQIQAGRETAVKLVLEPSFGVRGRITPPGTGSLTSSWAVLMRSDSVEAEARAELGYYRIEVEPPLGSTVIGISPFYAASMPEPAVSGGEVDLDLRPGGFVAGFVTDAAGEPVADFELGVESFEIDGHVPYGPREIGTIGFVSADGSFEFGPLRPGKYWLRAAASGHAPGSAGPIVVRGGASTDGVTITLSGGGVVRGRVVDPAGKPVHRAQVALFDPFSPFATARTRTAADGSYALTGVPEGRRSIRVARRGFLTNVSSGLDVRASGEVIRDLVLERAEKGEKFSFHGIGAVLSAEDGTVVVQETIPDRPASIFGLQAGDRILAVDGRSTAELRLGTVVELIRGEENVAVQLEIEREGQGRFAVEVERGRVVVK